MYLDKLQRHTVTLVFCESNIEKGFVWPCHHCLIVSDPKPGQSYWAVAKNLHVCCNPRTVRERQRFGLLSGGDIRVQMLAVGYVYLLSFKMFFFLLSNMQKVSMHDSLTLPDWSVLHLQTVSYAYCRSIWCLVLW